MKILDFAPKIYLYVIAWLFLVPYESHMGLRKKLPPHTRPKSYPPTPKSFYPPPPTTIIKPPTHRRDPVPKYGRGVGPSEERGATVNKILKNERSMLGGGGCSTPYPLPTYGISAQIE